MNQDKETVENCVLHSVIGDWCAHEKIAGECKGLPCDFFRARKKGGEKMPTVDFKFSVNQRVITSLGDDGLIDTLGFSSGMVRYYVVTKGGGGAWFDEGQLTAAE